MRTARLIILTPSGVSEHEVESVTAVDRTGSLGIMAGHRDFMTALRPAIIAMRKGDKYLYAAVDGGILRVTGGEVRITTRESVVSEDIEELKDVLVRRFSAREQKEEAFLNLLGNMEKLLVDRMVKFERG